VIDDIAAAIARLDAEPSPAAVRLDDPAALTGRVVVLPSAFNPPTWAHVRLLERAAARGGANQGLALLTTRNVDKGLYGASLPHRVGMLLAATAAEADFAVGAANQARILDQASALRAAFPAAQFDFVVGFDTLERLFAPRYYSDMEAELEPFFARHRVLAANRAGTGPRAVVDWIGRHAGRFAGAIETLELDEASARLSSTTAREAASTRDMSDVLPDAVRRYIRQHGLYRD
jgi:nicotinamide-nucleotide adenylyltransferase